MLHITNGDSAGQTIGAAGLPGDWLAWKDVLHEGPVQAGLALPDLSAERARYIASQGWGDGAAVAADFQTRDATLAQSTTQSGQDEVVLWFEHDLYDQLQLIQLLDWFAGQSLGGAGVTRLSLICVNSFPGKARFLGLGELTAAELASLFPTRLTVTADELALGRAAWAAFRAPDPAALETLLAGDTSALPYLAAALTRHLEEYPAQGDGLARTQRELLQVIAASAQELRAIFAAQQALEDAPYMGDLPLWSHLRGLSMGPRPLIALVDGGRFLAPHEAADPDQFAAQRVALTDDGRAVLAGQVDHLALNGIDRWLGGVHLRAGAPLWRWDSAARRLVRV